MPYRRTGASGWSGAARVVLFVTGSRGALPRFDPAPTRAFRFGEDLPVADLDDWRARFVAAEQNLRI